MVPKSQDFKKEGKKSHPFPGPRKKTNSETDISLLATEKASTIVKF